MAKDLIKQKIKQRLKKEVIKKLGSIAKKLLSNPWFWIITVAICLIISIVMLVIVMMSANQKVQADMFISDEILPPQIYYHDLEKTITSGFGTRVHPITGEKTIHNGIDIGVPIGTPISSSMDGVVSKVSFPGKGDAESTFNAGIYINVTSTDADIKMTMRYLHLSQSFVVPGQKVLKGEVIGLSGNTGRSTGPHLHYEAIPEGEEAVDPTTYILLMTKITDIASEAALKMLNEVDFESPDPSEEYRSYKMLYISGIYFGNEAPMFYKSGATFVRNLGQSSSDLYSSFPNGNVTVNPSPPTLPTGPIPVPNTNGTLSNPFFIKHAASAQAEERRSGIPASITLAQAALESGYGKSALCNNYFGIKASSNYSGPSCKSLTNEEVGGVMIPIIAYFRSYTSSTDSFADHSDFLLENKRYRTALTKENPYEFANELQRAGYATDSQYANKLKSIIREQNLTSLDMNGGIDPSTGLAFADVYFDGGGGSGGSGIGSDDTITVFFGITQYYGTYAKEIIGYSKSGKPITIDLKDPYTKSPIINHFQYDKVSSNIENGTIAPIISVKDLPQAMAVTVSGEDKDLYVSHVKF